MKALVVTALLVLAACHREPAHDHSAAPAAPGNPAQEEMRLLMRTLQKAIASIAEGDVRGLEHELHAVHTAKERTERALADGSYRPPKASAEVERFKAMDQAFHAELEKLVKASARNDVPATAQALGQVLAGCPTCHEVFRR